MRVHTLTAILAAATTSFFFASAESSSSRAFEAPTRYHVTITNITNAQQFTPLLVVTHNADVSLFTLGEMASPELTALAEFGNTLPFETRLMASPDVFDVQTSAGLLDPGDSVTVTVEIDTDISDDLPLISVAGMLIPTNDAFVAVNGMPAPLRIGRSIERRAIAYDSGTEVNDELCSSIPGPNFSECGGPGGAGSPGGGEGFVHVHRGMQGVGDMDAAMRDWRNPVASIRIVAAP